MLNEKKLLKQIEKIGDEACEIALKYYGNVDPQFKADRSHVTKADLTIEELLREKLPPLIPGSMIVGEETDIDPSEVKAIKQAEWVWVIDPIDGTGSFVDQLPFFCVSIGLARKGIPYAGVVRFPVGGARFEAVRGYGAFYNGNPIKLKRGIKTDFNSAFYTYSKSHWWFNINYTGKLRNVGTTAGHLCTIARGGGLGVLAHGAVWDYMGAAAVLLEAGGTLKYLDGKPINWKSILTQQKKLRLPVVAALPGRWKEVAGYVETLKEPRIVYGEE